MRTTAAWLTGCLLVGSVPGCASMQAAQERRERTQAALDDLHYRQPKDEVWQAVRQLLAERGCSLAGADAEKVGQGSGGLGRALSAARETYPYGSRPDLLQRVGIGTPPKPREDGSVSLDTDWRTTDDRYHVDGLVEPGGFRVVFTRVLRDRDTSEQRPYRDVELELALAARLDPEAAAKVERSASGRW